jgi:uncharacterized protein (TIGR02301 family)
MWRPSIFPRRASAALSLAVAVCACATWAFAAWAQSATPPAGDDAVAAAVAPDPGPIVIESAPADPDFDPAAGMAPEDGAGFEAGMEAGEFVEAQDTVTPSTPTPARRPRRALNDAGATGAIEWVTPPGATPAEQALIERAQRRERTLDPALRSELTRLSRTLGAMHALRVACAGREDQTWRSRMATLLDLEAPSGGAIRDPLVDAFNSGFQARSRGAGPCPADARAQEAALARDGRLVALGLAARYRPAAKETPAAP